jgi:DNA polymerase V
MYHDIENYEDKNIGVSMHAGFPNAAEDHTSRALDFNALLVWHPSSTYCFRVSGNTHQDRGIFDGDIAVIDRALNPRPEDLVLYFTDDNFAITPCRRLRGTGIWGVVTAIIHRTRV